MIYRSSIRVSGFIQIYWIGGFQRYLQWCSSAGAKRNEAGN
ncbi:hypothetical protein RchiOBHm_Chr1g0376051 [Rosa chinensis]|uniref:Uncharacterized protein n=1 Tax=Rosa chinensis TaxID=74649 RepID=A0A2P6SMS4_ROSCH|nr:hypothetical protein RchiOBHm_Chr1g0376051 [Rosa chinensis]